MSRDVMETCMLCIGRFVGVAGAGIALGAGAAVADPWLEQPATIPGNWTWRADPLPPLETVVDRVRPAVPVYGLYTWGGEYLTHRQSIADVGWTSIRMGGRIEDDTMFALVEDGLDVVHTLGGERRDQFDSDEAFLAAYHQSVVDTLHRYGPGGAFFDDHPNTPRRPITQVNIWNEPNFHYMIPDDPDRPRPEVEAEREALYAKLLPATYELIKHEWPDVMVVGFSAGGAGAGDRRWIQNVHEQSDAVADAYDAVSTQPYIDPAPPEAHSVRGWGSYSIAQGVATIRQTLAAFGRADAPLWFTEIGWAISQEAGGRFAMNRDAHATPELQAAYVTRLYALAMRLGVERVHIMFATDTDGYNGGFFLPGGTWRPSAHAVRHMIERMPQPRLTGAVSDGDEGYYAYLFSPGADRDDTVLMAWNVAGPRTVKVHIDGVGTVAGYDMLGHERTLTIRDGVLELEIGPYPVYVTVPAATTVRE
ncbi:MAG: hypothetical protein WD009_01690 [Phycisphaeraceae bacterium]